MYIYIYTCTHICIKATPPKINVEEVECWSGLACNISTRFRNSSPRFLFNFELRGRGGRDNCLILPSFLDGSLCRKAHNNNLTNIPNTKTTNRISGVLCLSLSRCVGPLKTRELATHRGVLFQQRKSRELASCCRYLFQCRNIPESLPDIAEYYVNIGIQQYVTTQHVASPLVSRRVPPGRPACRKPPEEFVAMI